MKYIWTLSLKCICLTCYWLLIQNDEADKICTHTTHTVMYYNINTLLL